MWQAAISDTVIQSLVGQLGLLILAGWFLILLLILRELRAFLNKHMTSQVQDDSAILALCRESVDNALSYVKNHAGTISELAKLQLSLESQLAEIKAAGQGKVSQDEQKRIDDLNRKLSRSHALIKKLKGDLDKSVIDLKSTSGKLYNQNYTLESLKKENALLLEKYEALEQEYEAAVVPDENNIVAMNFNKEKDQLLMTLESYRRQIAEQDQVIQQLETQHTAPGNRTQVQEMQKELEQTRRALKHLAKEKEFIESKYLDLSNEIDKPT